MTGADSGSKHQIELARYLSIYWTMRRILLRPASATPMISNNLPNPRQDGESNSKQRQHAGNHASCRVSKGKERENTLFHAMRRSPSTTRALHPPPPAPSSGTQSARTAPWLPRGPGDAMVRFPHGGRRRDCARGLFWLASCLAPALQGWGGGNAQVARFSRFAFFDPNQYFNNPPLSVASRCECASSAPIHSPSTSGFRIDRNATT